MPCKGNHPVKLITNVTFKLADRVDIHKYVESKNMASQEVGPPNWNLGRDTSNTPNYTHHITKLYSSDVSVSPQ